MNTARRAALLGVACVVAACGMLTAGLFPFHAPLNRAEWSDDGRSIHLQGYSWLVSSAEFRSAAKSLEIYMQPDPPTDDGHILWFSTSKDPLGFGMRQSHDGLVLENFRSKRNEPRARSMYVGTVFGAAGPTVVAVTANASNTAVYVNGALMGESKEFLLSPDDFTGRLVIGTSPISHDVWTGKLMGLALFRQPLTSEKVERHYRTWTTTSQPEASENPDVAALYLFRKGAGKIIPDSAGHGINIEIPKRFRLIRQAFLERPWNEFHAQRSYLMEILKNIVGFIPFGFLARAYLIAIGRGRSSKLVATALGAAISVTIEVLQALLPTRDSGMTDLMTNTFGTWLGCMLYEIKYLRGFIGLSPAAPTTQGPYQS